MLLVSFSTYTIAEIDIFNIEVRLESMLLFAETAFPLNECMNAIAILPELFDKLVTHLSSLDLIHRQECQEVRNDLLNTVGTKVIDISIIQEEFILHAENSHTLIECIGLFL